MNDFQTHFAWAVGETLQGGIVTARGVSGNRKGVLNHICRTYSRRERANAMRFINFLDEMPVDQAGGKTPFTCAEPQAIIDVLLQGADPYTVWIKNIKTKKETRTPCAALCGNYLRRLGTGYRLDWKYILRN